jgi:hypothetical protein
MSSLDERLIHLGHATVSSLRHSLHEDVVLKFVSAMASPSVVAFASQRLVCG